MRAGLTIGAMAVVFAPGRRDAVARFERVASDPRIAATVYVPKIFARAGQRGKNPRFVYRAVN
jgi:hypothetical protein